MRHRHADGESVKGLHPGDTIVIDKGNLIDVTVAAPTAAVAAKRRVPLWDNARFACVALVVIGHGIQRLTADSDTALIVYLTIYAFHMPAFAIISGYFSKSGALDKRAMRKVITDILLPYVIMETIWTVVQWLVEGKVEINPTKPSWTLWFLLALGIFRLVLPYLALLRWPLIISVVLSIGVSYLDNVDSTFSLARAIGILPFFVFGWRLRSWSIVDRWRSLSERSVLVVRAVALALFAITALVMTLNITLFREIDLRYWFFYDRSYSALGESEWWAGFFRLFLLAVALLLSFAFYSLIPRRRTWMTGWGQATMYVYLLHSFLLYPLRETDVLAGEQPTALLLVMIVVCVAIAVVLSQPIVQRVFRPLIEPKPRWIFADRGVDKAAPSRVDPTGSRRDPPRQHPIPRVPAAPPSTPTRGRRG